MSGIPYCFQTVLERCHVNPMMDRPIHDLSLPLPIKPARYWSTMDKVRFHRFNQQASIA
jgi:hypothetical protein